MRGLRISLLVALMLTSWFDLARTGRPALAQASTLAATATWSGGGQYYFLRAGPASTAPVVGRVVPGTPLTILSGVPGSNEGGNPWWYRVAVGQLTGYVSSNAVAEIEDVGRPWVAVVTSDGDPAAASVTAYRAPYLTAPTAARYPTGAHLPVEGMQRGDELESGDATWYRIAEGALPPVYVYSSYLKFAGWGTVAAAPPLLTAASAVAMDARTGRVMFSLNGASLRRPASTVKIMTALVALSRLPPSRLLPVPGDVQSVTTEVGGSSMGILPGETLSMHDLLYGMLLPSGNDAAYTIAQNVAGSQAAFVQLMNARAARLGLHHTHFTNATGLDEVGEHTSAEDLARLARYALWHSDLFSEIVRTATYAIAADRYHPPFLLHNLNQLLGSYPGADGVKTGTTPGAGENLIGAATRSHHRVLVVVLGATDRYGDATALLDYAFATWH